jgi:fatty acid desaturase
MTHELTEISNEKGRDRTQENELKAIFRSALSKENFKDLYKIKIHRTILDLFFIYLLLIFTSGLSCYFYNNSMFLAILPLAIFYGVAFNWINVQIHEASHFLLLPVRELNDYYCNIFLASFAYQDVESYRRVHLQHHAYLGLEKDPDLWIYSKSAGLHGSIILGILKDLFLFTAIKRKIQLRNLAFKSELKINYTLALKVLLNYFVLLVFSFFCTWKGAMFLYAIYLYGLLAIFPIIVRIRTVVQHCPNSLSNGKKDFISRSTSANFFEHLIFGARMDWHLEHHLFPTLPYYSCKLLHTLSTKNSLLNKYERKNKISLTTKNFLYSYINLSKGVM